MESCSCPCAFDNNGRFLALLTPDGRLKVWDCTNGSLKQQFTPSSHLSTTCSCLKWSTSHRHTDGPKRKKQKTSNQSSLSEQYDIIALGTTSGDILLYSLSAGEVQKRLEGGHSGQVTGLEWNRNGDLYSCSSDKYIVEWCTQKGEHKSKWKADKHGVNAIRISPLGNHLLSAGRAIKLWDLDTKQVLKKFTGHASLITDLLFLPNPTMPDSNANHVSASTVNGSYFLSGAQQDSLLSIWYVDLESKGKNSLLSLSITNEPISIDVARHELREKPVHIAVVSKDGKLHIFEQTLNGGGKKPVKPLRTVQLTSPAGKNSPVPFICAKLITDKEPSVIVAYGSAVKPQFETMTYSTMERHTLLTRETSSTLAIKEQSQPSGPVDKGKKDMTGVTNLGPTSMALPRPAVATQQTSDGSTVNTRHEKSLEERLQAMNDKKPKRPKRVATKHLPQASSVVQMLSQALHSQDNQLLEEVLQNGIKSSRIHNTVRRLPVSLVVPFISELVFKIQVSPNRGSALSVWLQQLLSVHMSYLMTIPNLVESLSNLYTMMESRVGVYGKLCKLQGRLDLILSQVASQSEAGASGEEASLNEPLAYYQEEDSDDEDDVHMDEGQTAEDEPSDERWEEESDEDVSSGPSDDDSDDSEVENNMIAENSDEDSDDA